MNKYFNRNAEQKQSPHLKRAPFKYPKWKFSSQINHSVFLPNFAQNFRYTQNEQANRSYAMDVTVRNSVF